MLFAYAEKPFFFTVGPLQSNNPTAQRETPYLSSNQRKSVAQLIGARFSR